MKRFPIYLWATVLAVLIISRQALAQPGPAHPPPLPVEKVPTTPQYQVIPFGHNSAVMIHLQSGKSWKLERDAENTGHFVWVPIQRLATNMELDDWQQRMKKFRAERRKRREAEFGEAVPLEGRFDFAVPEGIGAP